MGDGPGVAPNTNPVIEKLLGKWNGHDEHWIELVTYELALVHVNKDVLDALYNQLWLALMKRKSQTYVADYTIKGQRMRKMYVIKDNKLVSLEEEGQFVLYG